MLMALANGCLLHIKLFVESVINNNGMGLMERA